MRDAIRYLLPAIPTVLYGGLGKAGTRWNGCGAAQGMRAHLGKRELAVTRRGLRLAVPGCCRSSTRSRTVLAPASAGRTGGADGRAAGSGLRHAEPEIDDCENRQRVLTSEPSPTTPIAPSFLLAPAACIATAGSANCTAGRCPNWSPLPRCPRHRPSRRFPQPATSEPRK